jgi:Na+-driven multidrug efflux pump
VITAFTTLGNGISNYCAQNIGAGKLKRIPEGFRAGIKMVWLLSLPLALLYFTCSRWLLLFFMSNPSEDAMHAGMMLLRIVAPFYFVISAKLVADGILRGASFMGRFMAATFTDLILRVVLAIIFSGTRLGSTGIWCAWPVGWSVATCISIFFYLRGPWYQDKQTH